MKNKVRVNLISYGMLLLMLVGCNLQSNRTTTPSTSMPFVNTPSAPASETPSVEAPTAEGSTPGASPSGLCDNPLFPVKQDVTWTYTNSDSLTGTFTYTDKITDIRTDGFTFTTQYDDATYPQEWSCKPEGLQLTQFSGSLAKLLSLQGISAELNTSDMTGVTLPANITPGMKWTYSFNLKGTITYEGKQIDAKGAVTTNLQEAGSESITVPAGTFEATRIQATSNSNLTATYLGFDVPDGYSTQSTLWYAPGVGLVKMTETSNFEGMASTLTSELQSYNVP